MSTEFLYKNMIYDPNTLCPKIPVSDAVSKFFMTDTSIPKEIDAKSFMFLSNEFLHDVAAHWKSLFSVRTGQITETEIAEWKQAQTWLDKESIQDKQRRLETLGFEIDKNQNEC